MKHTTLRVLADQFDAFFIDQFGVLMDATGAYPFAIDSVKRLSELGKPMILLSNSGKRAFKNEERLTRLGFEVCLFTKVITCLLYTSPSPRDATLSRMPSSA